jgi:hypothetical protein
LRLRLWREGASEDTAQDAGTRDRAPIRAPAPIAGKGWGCDRGQQDNDQQLFQLLALPVATHRWYQNAVWTANAATCAVPAEISK